MQFVLSQFITYALLAFSCHIHTDIWINELSHRVCAVTAIFRLRTYYVN